MTIFNGTQTVGERTVSMVMRMLRRQGSPMTITQLSEATGKSYNTVKAALKKGGAVQVRDSYPKVFTIPALYEEDRYIGDSRENVLVPFKEIEPIVGRWNDARFSVGRTMSSLEITPDSDPAELYKLFTDGAVNLGSIAYRLSQVKDMVDWYEKLGGKPDEGE